MPTTHLSATAYARTTPHGDAALSALALIRDPYRRSIDPDDVRLAYEYPRACGHLVPRSSVTTNLLRLRFAHLALHTYAAARTHRPAT